MALKTAMPLVVGAMALTAASATNVSAAVAFNPSLATQQQSDANVTPVWWRHYYWHHYYYRPYYRPWGWHRGWCAWHPYRCGW